ncbi:MAG: MerR family transcriptional regulator [Rhodospirillaceae bacterium]|jgi:DNA-binding transcriptional MerR regulator|nr:MerR family transcriptional regulator [Rhodospirillaceae bacterium]MBT4220493.1 MerR family transcriptional regulator [Rhodospirillaceae bacterium]MBT5308036.1 MerR family transcriptional regulator [Rhodospirillaceae bacterium]MBT7355642.1 MerR family transcriptional regulator [Rhodospirillaceae bacterium]
MTEKSASAFRTISEVAKDLDLPQHVLRFWETKFPDIKPMKRGGGRRYYRPEDIDLIRRIQSLLHDNGYTIKGAQKLLREGSADDLPKPVEAAQPEASGMDEKQRKELTSIARELQDLRDILKA